MCCLSVLSSLTRRHGDFILSEFSPIDFDLVDGESALLRHGEFGQHIAAFQIVGALLERGSHAYTGGTQGEGGRNNKRSSREASGVSQAQRHRGGGKSGRMTTPIDSQRDAVTCIARAIRPLPFECTIAGCPYSSIRMAVLTPASKKRRAPRRDQTSRDGRPLAARWRWRFEREVRC